MRSIIFSIALALFNDLVHDSNSFVVRYSALSNKNTAFFTKHAKSIRFLSTLDKSEIPVETEVGEDSPRPNNQLTLDQLEVDSKHQGVVTNVLDYGVFVDIGAEVNGLVHISQIADTFVASPQDTVKIGDVVDVKVLVVDPANKKLQLTMRKTPKIINPYQTDDLSPFQAILDSDPSLFIEGTVEHIIEAGAFVKITEPEGYGFIHISQMRSKEDRVSGVSDVLAVGQKTQVRILNVDNGRKRLNLSMTPYLTKGNYFKGNKDVSSVVDIDRNMLIKGTVASLHEYGAFVTIKDVDGLLHTSKIEEKKKYTYEELKERFKVGDEVEVRILNADASTNKLSLTMLPPEPDLSRFENLAPDEWIEGNVVSLVSYGAFVDLGEGIDGMVHISEIGDKRLDSIEEALTVGEKVKVRVIDVNTGMRKIKLSMKPFGESADDGEERFSFRRKKVKNVEKFLDFDSEEWIDGKVQSMTDFGAFVRLDDNIDGLLHLSQMADYRVEDPEEVLSLDQEVKVRIIDVDAEGGRISLSMKEPNQASQERRPSRSSKKPSQNRDVSALANFDPAALYQGTVASIVSFGCFVEIEGTDGIQGLLHISEMSDGRIEYIEDLVNVGDKVSVRIIDVDEQAGKVSLTMLSPDSEKAAQRTAKRGSDDYGADGDGDNKGLRRKSPRPRFNDLAYLEGGVEAQIEVKPSEGEKDWHKYLDNYFDKKD